MAGKAVVVGIDGSPASARAAAFGWRLAQALRSDCRLVYVAPDTWLSDYAGQPPMAPRRLLDEVVALARGRIAETLAGVVPAELVDALEVRLGRPAVALRAAGDQFDAPYIVLGGKHHTALGRTLAGSTARDLVRTTDRPVLVLGDGDRPIRRILAAIDLSAASRATVAAARRLTRVSDAELRVMTAVEPVRVPLTIPFAIDEAEIGRRVAAAFERMQRAIAGTPPGEWVLRRGAAEEAIATEAAEWGADLVVVGSHGKGWVDRVLIGSTTERLLAALPAGLLVVPTGRRTAPRRMPTKAGVTARRRVRGRSKQRVAV
jgi:nucleotide-binding universal stress UspA family protein